MTVDGKTTPGFRQRPLWLLTVAALAVAQVGWAVQLFGPDHPWDAARDDRPVLDGRHPLHLYHGSLGAATFREFTATTCYDPSFQAGYPKTPVFDSAARPAELVLYAVGTREFDPAAYKLGLLGLCGLVPLVFVAASRGFGASPAGTCWAGVGGCLVWWSAPVRAVFDAGDIDLLCVGLAVVLFLGGMARYASRPGLTGWVVMAVASAAGWYVHPVVWAGLLPAVAVFYLVNAPRHGLAWHLGAIAVLAVGVAVNVWWLSDWSAFWWVRRGSENIDPPNWTAFLDVNATHGIDLGTVPGGWVPVVAAALGLLLMIRRERCGAVGVLLVSAVAAVVMTRLAAVWPAARGEGADHAVAVLPAFLVLPIGFAAGELLRGMKIGAPLSVGVVVAFALTGWHAPTAAFLADTVPAVRPLQLGVSPARQELIDALKRHTTRAGRILIEDTDPTRPGWNWTALLPYQTDRLFLGGLDPDAGVEHAHCEMRNGRLAGRAFADWTAADRGDYCRRYNVGWVLCRSEEAATWWAADPTAKLIGRFDDDGVPVVLFVLKRPLSFVLSGQATVERMDRGRIILTDVVPDADGRVRLSLHYERQLRAAPLVWMEPEKDPHDPVPFITLYAPGPVSRVTLTWEHP